jgi:hypothetical protein
VAAGLQDQRQNLDSVNVTSGSILAMKKKKGQRYLGGNKERYRIYELIREDAHK